MEHKIKVKMNTSKYRTNRTRTQATNFTVTTSTIHPFNGLFFRTTLASQYKKGATSLDFNKARDDGVLECSGPYANNLHLASDT